MQKKTERLGGEAGAKGNDLTDFVQFLQARMRQFRSVESRRKKSKQVLLLEQATQTLLTMVRELRQNFHLEKVQKQNDQLQTIEGEADKLMLELLRDLYSGGHDPVKVVILKDLYELLDYDGYDSRDRSYFS